tara:strand:+ start:3170 stop:5287 length:2118 start_codon:yes stop_codon:yes gene_type:complete
MIELQGMDANITSYLARRFSGQSDRNGQGEAEQAKQQGNYAPFLPKLLSVLGWRGDVKTLRDALPLYQDRIGFTDFLNALSYLGYPPKIIKTSIDKINPDMVPCLFIPAGAHFGEIIYDVQGLRKNKGTAYVFMANTEKTDVIPDKTISASGLKWFTRLLYRFKAVFWQVFTASLIINFLALVTPLFMMSVYDKVIGAHSPATLHYLVAGVLLAIGVEFTLRFLRSRSLSWFGARIDYIVSNAILARILALPASYTERASVAAQLSRLKAFESVREFFTGPLFLSFVEFPFTLILLAAIAILAGPLVFVPLVIAFLYLILLLVMRPKLKALTTRMATANAERQNMNIETLGKQETLRNAGGYTAWLSRYEKTNAEASLAGYRYNQAVSFIDTLAQGLSILGGVAMIYFGVERIWDGHMSMGAMIAILILTWRTLSPLQTACTALPRLDQIKRNIEQINRLMELAPEREAYIVGREIPKFIGEIEFYNVGLRYSKDADPVYAGLSFKVEPGQLISITGANSTGKSTTLKLISGLYNPQAGSIRIDGIDIRQIDSMRLRQNIAYVGQEPDFFGLSLADNLRLVKPDATISEIKDALDKAGLHEWLQSLPHSFDTILGHGGVSVPNSLCPQLSLARAYLQDAKIMLIDELPYEFLNSDAGEDFYAFLENSKGKRTILYISYRQDYIALADKNIQLYQDARPLVKDNKE